eukprot:1191179-Prorocentrum_minimum.AAC.3
MSEPIAWRERRGHIPDVRANSVRGERTNSTGPCHANIARLRRTLEFAAPDLELTAPDLDFTALDLEFAALDLDFTARKDPPRACVAVGLGAPRGPLASVPYVLDQVRGGGEFKVRAGEIKVRGGEFKVRGAPAGAAPRGAASATAAACA